MEQNNTLVQQSFKTIQELIIRGELKPGQKLKVEELKELLHMGQSPIREALSKLAAGGLVEAESNRGFYVARISEQDIRDIYTTFTHIENMALALALEKGGVEWETGIIAALYQLGLIEKSKEPASIDIWTQKNYAFHVALISGCNSPTLLKIRHDLYLKFDRYCRIAFNLHKNTLSLNHEEHEKMAQAALQRNTKEAQALMTYHINGALDDVIELLKMNNIL